MVRTFVLVLGAVGALAFASLLALSFARPVTLERWARLAIQHEVEARVAIKTQALSESALIKTAERVLGSNNQELKLARQELANLPARVARISGEMLDPECPCRARMRELLRESLTARVTSLSALSAQLTALIQAKYAEVSHSLLRELHIFCGANAAVFSCLWGVAFVRRKAKMQLLLPAVVLLGAAGVVGYLYLFTQNWLQTVLLGQYVGLWYFPYLGLAIALLADISFNRARVTTELVNGLLSAVGSAASAVPC